MAGCRIDGLLGRGSMGEVWRAVHLALKRPVALKILAIGRRDAAAEEAILREARALAQVEHPDVVKVYDVRFEGEILCILLELLEGRTLLARVNEDGAFLESDLLDVASGVTRGLAAIHAAGLVHRDLKLDNVIVTDAGQAKITDFGLALAREARDGYEGCIVGTPAYISPEQWLGRPVDARADLYALGVLLYACATGALPFRGKTPEDFRAAHLKAAPRAPGGVLGSLILKLLTKERAKRPPTAAAVLAEIERCRRGDDEEDAEEVDAGPLEIGLRAGEFSCPGCAGVVERGARACPGCGKGFCKSCLTRLAAAAGLCAPCGKKAAGPPRR